MKADRNWRAGITALLTLIFIALVMLALFSSITAFALLRLVA